MSNSAEQIFRTTAETFSTLMRQGNKFFYIPAYQREYNWKDDKVQRLVEGAVRSLTELKRNSNSFNFLGTIITVRDQEHKTVDEKHRPSLPANVLLLIDGQQRMTTLVLLVIALHNRLRKTYERQRNIEESKKTNLDKFIETENASTLNQIQDLVIHKEFIPPNDHIPFVRMIRAFEDSWSHNPTENIYESPIANLVYRYGITNDGFDLSKSPKIFTPAAYPSPSNRNTCRARFLEIIKLLKGLHEDGIGEERLKLPTVKILTNSPNVLRELLPNISDDQKLAISELNDESELNQEISDLLFTRFVLHRIVLTVVAVQDDENAFDVFDALNTTGQPLAPFEMFKPLVMAAVGLENYGGSKDKSFIDDIASKLGDLDTDSNLTDAKKIAVSFALAESGHRLGNDSVAQRNFYRVSFARATADSAPQNDRLEYIQNLSTITNFHKLFFKSNPKQPEPLSPQVSGECLTCLSFLAKSKHTLVIPVLSQFWGPVFDAPDEQSRASAVAEFEKIVKGITAFTVLYRAVSRSTEGIDQVYRDIMTGDKSPTGLGPLHRSNFNFRAEEVRTVPNRLSATELLADLLGRITDPLHRELTNKSDFVEKAKKIPIYEVSQPIARFMLFVAMHDNKYDSTNPGLLVQDFPNSNQLLTPNEWLSEDALSVEHIAPQTKSNGWDPHLYQDQVVDTLGNLTLCPSKVNSYLGNATWIEKRSVYKALNMANGLDDAKQRLKVASSRFENLAEALENLEITKCKFFGNLGDKQDEWNTSYVNKRTENLLDLIWDRLITWLQ